ncbi:MAG: DUF2914 domain-containing protein [Pseudomonadota bacterium]
MAEKKVVLRLKLKDRGPSEPRISEVAAPTVVTEWNYPRIAAVLAVIVLVVSGILVWGLSGDDDLSPDKGLSPNMSAGVAHPEAISQSDSLEPDAFVQSAEPESGRQPVKPTQTLEVAESASKTDASTPRPPEVTMADAKKIETVEAVEAGKTEASDVQAHDAETQSPEVKRAAVAEKRESPAPVSGIKAAPNGEKKMLGKGVVRAKLSRGIWQREPFGKVVTPVRAEPDRAIGLFFFTELEGAQGQRFFHQWLRDGKLVFEQPVRLRAGKTRFYTSKLLNTNMLGRWEVILKDARGRVLYREGFQLIGPED